MLTATSNPMRISKVSGRAAATRARRSTLQVRAESAAAVAPKPAEQDGQGSAAARRRASDISTSQDFTETLPDMDKSVMGIILGGGAGSRLYPLTKKRAKPAVPLGANYRLIDIPVSNCINSGVNKIYVLTQFNSASLNRHLSNAYNSNIGGYNAKGFVEVLAAAQSPSSKAWFQGTADAVRKYIWQFEDVVRREPTLQDYLILAGDHLYRCNYSEFVQAHRDGQADITVAALACDEAKASAFGLMKIDDSRNIVEFAEKPKGEALRKMRVDTTILGLDAERAKKEPYIASMGIYVAKASVIRQLLNDDFPTANDFGSEIIPGAVEKGLKVQAYLYDGYWEDIGTISSFYKANIALTSSSESNFSFYDAEAPIYTQTRFLPPSSAAGGVIEGSIIGDGCKIGHNARIVNSVIGLRTIILENCVVEDTLFMGSDYYEEPDECMLVPHCVPMGLGRGSVVRKAIIDKNARIGSDVQLINKDNVVEANLEDRGIIIKDGILVVIKDTVVPNGTII